MGRKAALTIRHNLGQPGHRICQSPRENWYGNHCKPQNNTAIQHPSMTTRRTHNSLSRILKDGTAHGYAALADAL